MGRKVVAIVGSYRKGGTVDTAVQAILEGARENGAETHTSSSSSFVKTAGDARRLQEFSAGSACSRMICRRFWMRLMRRM